MTKLFNLTVLAALAILLVAPRNASAVPLLAVDFGYQPGGSPTPVQAGFIGIAGGPSQASRMEAIGSYTVTVTGEGFYSAETPGGVDASITALYEDYFYNNSITNGVGIALSIAGVVPNTAYDLTLWSYDEDNFSLTPTVWSPSETTTGTSGFITNFEIPYPTTLADNSATIRVQSTTNVLDIFGTSTGGTGGTRLNGFTLSVVPEPSTAMLAGIGACLIGLGCRRTKQRGRG